MVPEIPLMIGNCKNDMAASLDFYMTNQKYLFFIFKQVYIARNAMLNLDSFKTVFKVPCLKQR